MCLISKNTRRKKMKLSMIFVKEEKKDDIEQYISLLDYIETRVHWIIDLARNFPREREREYGRGKKTLSESSRQRKDCLSNTPRTHLLQNKSQSEMARYCLFRFRIENFRIEKKSGWRKNFVFFFQKIRKLDKSHSFVLVEEIDLRFFFLFNWKKKNTKNSKNQSINQSERIRFEFQISSPKSK